MGLRKIAVVSRLINVGANAGGLLLAAIAALMCLGIVTRVFGKAIPGVYEIVSLAMGLVVATALTYTTLARAHIVVTMLVSRLPKRVQTVLRIVAGIVSIGIWALIAWANVNISVESGLAEISETLGIPWLPFRCVFVVGIVLGCVALLNDIVVEWKGRRED